MATSFAAQLSQIAAASTHELDLRARRNLHAESLLFPRDVAAKQDFDTIYTICLEGFRDLCQLDARFGEFDRNLFSPQAKEQDRERMNRAENEALDSVIERVLSLLGGRILLNPAVRMLEWLVRRFKVHVYNTASLILMLLPYHEMPIWRNALSIIPTNRLVAEWKWAAPYKSDSLNVPRHVIVHALTNNDGFWTRWNSYMISTTREGFQYTTLLQFWNGLVIEAVVGRLSAARSGRREIQRERMQDTLLKILPILSDGFEIKNCPDLTTALFTIAMVLAAKADLDDRVLDSLLQTVSMLMTEDEVQTRSAIITAANLVNHKQNRIMPRQSIEAFRNLPRLEEKLQLVASTYSIDALLEGLVAGTMSSTSSKKGNLATKLAFMEKLLRFSFDLKAQTAFKACLKHIFSRISPNSIDNDNESILRSHLLEVLRRIREEDKMSHVLAEAAHESGQDLERLEALIGGTLALPSALLTNNDAMEIDEQPIKDTSLQELLSSAPSRTADVSSFLAKFDHSLFEHLLQCFERCCKKEDYIPEFITLPIWSSATSGQLLLVTFLLRVGMGNFSILSRTTALKLVLQRIRDMSATDMQAIIPYALTALSEETSLAIRHAAAELITAVQKVTAEGEISDQFGRSELYDHDRVAQVIWISKSHLLDVLGHILLPVMEDCILDASKVTDVVEFAMNGPSQTGPEGFKIDRAVLKKGVSRGFLDLITSHAVATPIWRVKLCIITLLRSVQKVGTTSKTIALAPVLNEWASYDESTVQNVTLPQGLVIGRVDEIIASIVSSNPKDAPNDALTVLQQDFAAFRPSLAAAIFHRVQHLWNDFKSNLQASIALRLFELSFSDTLPVSRGAQEVLQSVALSTDAVGAILEQSLSSITQVRSEEQPRKRRRTSHGRESLPPDLAKAVDAATSQLTFALELVEGSEVENRPELLTILFDTLAFLRRLKQQQRMLSPYLLHLCLSSISSIVRKQREFSKPTIDVSSIRADLVTDCIQNSESPQVQNTALLLSASLASLTPDRMLHQVMPIFTFMGQNMFAKEDDHSVYVIFQAINHIIPALVNGLRKQNKDMIKSTSGILSSFAAAFDHIPQHRKVPIYQQLLNNMGGEDFAFILIAMLAVRKEVNKAFTSFLADLMAELPVLTQLITYRKLLDLAADVKRDQPTIATDIFDIGGPDAGQECDDIHRTILETTLGISQLQSLTTTLSKLHKIEDEKREILRREITSSLRQLLSIIRENRVADHDADIAKQGLDAFLKLPPLFELLALTPAFLHEMNAEQDLKPQILRVIAAQLEGNPPKDIRTRTAAIDLLGKLSDLLRADVDSAMMQATIVAIDRISEVYGRKDVDVVLATATAVCDDVCLKSKNRRTRTMSLLCLASMLEVLKEASAPIVSDVVLQTIATFDALSEQQDEEVYDALNSLVAALFSHVSFLILDERLQDLIALCIKAAFTYQAQPSTESRTAALNIIARKTELPILLCGLQNIASSEDEKENIVGRLESLEVLSKAIDVSSKTQIIKNADSISQLILAHLDYRRRHAHQSDADSNISDVESKVNDVSIQYIYKLNDTTFRPVFETWIDWAIKAYDIANVKDFVAAQRLRQTALFELLSHFFSTLKSIVTSYAGYIITPTATILDSIAGMFESEGKKPTLDQAQLNLYSSVLDVLRATFEHDADGFFATPSHFDPLGQSFVRQLHLVSSKTYRNLVYQEVVPTIVALAAAVTDTPTHHQTLSHGLTTLRRSSSAAIRLASIRTLAALSSDEDVGDDFIANTIGVGSATGVDGDGMGIARGGGSSAGELMIYVNEMLEDDDEDVEMEVRKWVQSIREKVGEDVFEV